jgi:hypothetical protein
VASIASRCVGTCGGNIDGVLIAGDIGLALERGCSPGSRFVPGNWPRRKTVWPRDDTARFKVRFACGGLCACIRRISAGFRDRGTIPKVLEVLAVAQGAVVGLVLSLGCMPCAGEPWVLRQHQLHHHRCCRNPHRFRWPCLRTHRDLALIFSPFLWGA